MKDGATRQLEIVLRLTKEPGAHVIGLTSEREVWVPAVIRTSAREDRIRIAAGGCDLRLLMGSAKNRV